MSAKFEAGFFVREPAWHNLGIVIPDFLPLDTEWNIREAMRLAGHDFTIVEKPVYVGGKQGAVQGYKALVKSTPDNPNGTILNIANSTYGVIENRECWDLMQAIVGQGMKLETAITLDEGRQLSLLAWLDEPAQVYGDDSLILPFYNLSWSHDGSGAVSGRPTEIRTVCWNTQSYAESAGKARGNETAFSIRHTKNAIDRVKLAKTAIINVRKSHQEYMVLANELAHQAITATQREAFIQRFIPMPLSKVEISDRVVENIETARNAIRGLFDGRTVPDAHRFTAYGLHLAGVEYLDHLRSYRNQETYFGRSLLRSEPAKIKLHSLIEECVAL